MFDMDESRDEWMEEIYENQARYPLSSWPDESKSYWTNVVCTWSSARLVSCRVKISNGR